MKKLYFLSCICSFLLLVVSPTFIRHELLAEESMSDSIRGDTATNLRDQPTIDAQKEKQRDRDAIICTQKIPANPREDRGVYTICSPTPNSQPTNTPGTPTPTPKGIGGEPTDAPQPGPSSTPEPGKGGVSSSQPGPTAPVVGLSKTSGEGGLLLIDIRFIALVWFTVSAKKLFGEYRSLGKE